MTNEVLTAPLGTGLVLALPRRRALHLLNATAAEMWFAYQARSGQSGEDALLRHLQRRYDLDALTSKREIDRLVHAWKEAGLVEGGRRPISTSAESDPWAARRARTSPRHAEPFAIDLAGCRIAVEIEDRDLRAAVRQVIAPMIDPGSRPCSHLIRLDGDSNRWFVSLNGAPTACGASSDEAAVLIIDASIDLACRIDDALLIVHAAGVASPNGKTALLVAPSRSGKTTLAAGLNADGFDLLSDDVLVVGLDGRLRGLPTPICLKSGSWRVLADRRPDIDDLPVHRRYNEPVRFLPPSGKRPSAPRENHVLFFPRFRPGAEPSFEALSQEATFRKLIDAPSIVPNLTQARLEALTRWVCSFPAYSLGYPDLDSGMALVRGLLDGEVA